MSYTRRIIEFFYRNNYSTSINRRFQERLLDHEGDSEQEDALQNMWDNIGFPSASLRSEKAYERLRLEIKPKKKSLSLYRWIRAVAFWVIPISMIGTSLYLYEKSLELNSLVFEEKYIPYGKREQIILPDSTEVWLNSATYLIYPSKFIGKNREVYLVGEGFFRVKKNDQQSFIVNTDRVKFQVLGTEFNVSSYPDQDNVSAALERGSIKIIPKDVTLSPCILEPDYCFSYRKSTGETSIERVKAADYSDWREGGLFFYDTSLEEILKSLERAYAVKIYLRSSAYASNRLTIHFNKHESLENILALLKELVPSMNYEIREKKIILF